MTGALGVAALVLFAATIPLLAVLILRRWQLAHQERIQGDMEERVTPLALALVDGDADDDQWELEPGEGQAIAHVLGRYSRLLSGDARARIARFFEKRGLVELICLDATNAYSSWHRTQAVRILGEMASSQAVGTLVKCLDDANGRVRMAAVRSLALLGAAEAAEPIVRAMVDERVPHMAAANALLDIGAPILPQIEPLIDADDPGMRAIALQLVAQLGHAGHAGAVAARLDDPSTEVRARACRALGRVGSADSARALRASLADPDPSVRAAAAVALGDVGDAGAVDSLAEQAQSDEFGPARHAAQALARIAPERVVAMGRETGASMHINESADRVALGLS